jgi:hypothetical protein
LVRGDAGGSVVVVVACCSCHARLTAFTVRGTDDDDASSAAKVDPADCAEPDPEGDEDAPSARTMSASTADNVHDPWERAVAGVTLREVFADAFEACSTWRDGVVSRRSGTSTRARQHPMRTYSGRSPPALCFWVLRTPPFSADTMAVVTSGSQATLRAGMQPGNSFDGRLNGLPNRTRSKYGRRACTLRYARDQN